MVTADVELPEQEEASVLEWAGENNTALMDVLLLLSLFTGREVFAGPPGMEGFDSDAVIRRDSRIYRWGGALRSSLQYKGAPDRGTPPASDVFECNVGFEQALNQIYNLIRSTEWQQEYCHGYFLFLARQAFQQEILEAAFVQCWTIWEHLFAIHNLSWLSSNQIRRLDAHEKIAYLLVKYELVPEISKRARQRVQERLSQTRNRLIHFGRFPEYDKVHDDAELFIRLTEEILAKILGLKPSNVFNQRERLAHFFGDQED